MEDSSLNNGSLSTNKSYGKKYKKFLIPALVLLIFLLLFYFITVSNIDTLLNRYILSQYNLVCGYSKSSSSIFSQKITLTDFYINSEEKQLFKAKNLTLQYDLSSIFSKKLQSLAVTEYEIDIDNILSVVNAKKDISVENIQEAQNNQAQSQIQNQNHIKDHVYNIDDLQFLSIFQDISLSQGKVVYIINGYKVTEDNLDIAISRSLDNHINISKLSNVHLENINQQSINFTTDINTSLNLNSLDYFMVNMSIGLNNKDNAQAINFQNHVYLNKSGIGDLVNSFLDEASFQFSIIEQENIFLEGIITAGESADKCFQKTNVKSIDGVLLCSKFQGSKIDKSVFNQFIPEKYSDYHFGDNNTKYINGSGFISFSLPNISSYKISFKTIGSPFYYKDNKLLEKADLTLEYQKFIDKSPQIEIKLMDLVSINNSMLQSKGIIKNIFGSQDFDISIISDIKDFAGLKNIIPSSSNVELLSYIPKRLSSNIYIKGGISDISSKNYEDIQIKGSLVLEDLLLNLNSIPSIHLDNIDINMTTKKIDIINSTLNLSGSQYKVSGFIEDYLNYIFNQGSLKGELKAYSPYVKVNQLLKDIDNMKNKQILNSASLPQQTNISKQKNNENINSKNTKAKDKGKDTGIEVSKDINLIIKTNLKKVVHDNVNLENIKGKITIKKGRVTIDNVEAKAFRGTIKLGGNIDLYKSNNNHMADLNLSYKDISLSAIPKNDLAIFSNIKGKISGNIKLNANLDKFFTFDKNSIQSKGKINFINPEIDSKNIILSSVSLIKRSVSKSSLDNIKVKDFAINWKYYNQKVDIEPVTISLDNNKIELAGSFYDNQYLDYKAKVTLDKMPYVRVDIKGTKDEPKFYVNSDDAGKLIKNYVYQKGKEYLKNLF